MLENSKIGVKLIIQYKLQGRTWKSKKCLHTFSTPAKFCLVYPFWKNNFWTTTVWFMNRLGNLKPDLQAQCMMMGNWDLCLYPSLFTQFQLYILNLATLHCNHISVFQVYLTQSSNFPHLSNSSLHNNSHSYC